MKQDIQELITKAQQKDSKSMEKLGVCYLKGTNGLPTNPTYAYKLFKESAEMGNLNSLYHIAKTHLVDSYGVKDIKKGISLLKKAASAKHTDSLFELGKIYYYGKIQDKDIEEAENYLRKASNSEDSNPKAQYLLAYIWENGLLDGYVNINDAFKYYKKSAEKGNVDSLFKCAVFYLSGIEDLIAPNLNQSITLLKEATEKGHLEAHILLSSIYLQESIRLLEKTSKTSDDSMIVLNALLKIDLSILK